MAKSLREQYVELLAKLREQRQTRWWRPSDDREILAEMEDIYTSMDQEDRDYVETIGVSW